MFDFIDKFFENRLNKIQRERDAALEYSWRFDPRAREKAMMLEELEKLARTIRADKTRIQVIHHNRFGKSKQIHSIQVFLK